MPRTGSAWLHLLIDLFGSGGIPLLAPTGPRRGFSAYRNGGVGELLVIAPVHAIELGLPWFIQHPYGL